MEFDGKDLGYIEDAINCIAELYNAETHALSTFAQTKNQDWLEFAEIIRTDRSKLLYEITPNNQGESYCFLKHISGAIRILQELGNRKLESDDKEYAKELFEKADKYKKIAMLIISEGGKNVK